MFKTTASSPGAAPGPGAWISQTIETLRTSLWFVPTLMVLAGGLLALVLPEVDRQASHDLQEHLPWLYQGGAEGARGVLSSIASSMVSVVGVTFSITIVALVLASTQYTPRLLRNFMGDRGNQVVMGGFLATFTYALLVLRTVRGENHQPFVPQLAVTVSVVMALGCLGLFVYFIHHIAQSIQASTIIAGVAAETSALIDRLYPAEGAEALQEAPPALPDGRGAVIPAPETGYLQVVDVQHLLRVGRKEGFILRVEPQVGEFVTAREPLVTVWPPQVTVSQQTHIQRAFGVGRHRTMQHDPGFGFRQIVDIGVKALSPGINDPTTAVTCVDYLGSLLAQLQGRAAPSPCHCDEKGQLRLVLTQPDFAALLDLAFRELRQYGAGSVAVLLRLLEVLTLLGKAAPSPQQRDLLWRQVRQIAATADAHVVGREDRGEVNRRLQAAAAALGQDASPVLLRGQRVPPEGRVDARGDHQGGPH